MVVMTVVLELNTRISFDDCISSHSLGRIVLSWRGMVQDDEGANEELLGGSMLKVMTTDHGAA